MSVRKPLKKQKGDPINVDIEALIDKGAKVKEDRETDGDKKWTNINIRISVDMLKQVDRVVSNRVGITRTGWILEALHEILKKQEL